MTATTGEWGLPASTRDTGPRRNASLSDVLRLVHERGPVTRSPLAAELGLSRSGVRMLITELCDYGLVAERPGEPPGTAGRRGYSVPLRQCTTSQVSSRRPCMN